MTVVVHHYRPSGSTMRLWSSHIFTVPRDPVRSGGFRFSSSGETASTRGPVASPSRWRRTGGVQMAAPEPCVRPAPFAPAKGLCSVFSSCPKDDCGQSCFSSGSTQNIERSLSTSSRMSSCLIRVLEMLRRCHNRQSTLNSGIGAWQTHHGKTCTLVSLMVHELVLVHILRILSLHVGFRRSGGRV